MLGYWVIEIVCALYSGTDFKVCSTGTSYNPSYGDHQKLLGKAVSQEATHLMLQEKVKRTTTDMFPTIDKAPTEATWLAEMSQGLPKEEEEENEEEEEKEGKTGEVRFNTGHFL